MITVIVNNWLGSTGRLAEVGLEHQQTYTWSQEELMDAVRRIFALGLNVMLYHNELLDDEPENTVLLAVDTRRFQQR